VALAINEMIAMEQAAVFLFAVSGLLRACCSAVIARLVVATGRWSGEGQGGHPFPSRLLAAPVLSLLPGRFHPLPFLRHRKRNAD